MRIKNDFDVGKIVTTQGLNGEVRAEAWCDAPSFLAGLKSIGVGKPENRMAVVSGRVQKNMVILKLDGVDSIEEAAKLRGRVLYVQRREIPVEEGQFLIQDLIGCSVFDADDGQQYGTVCDVSQTGANDVWHIRFLDGSLRLIPYIPQVVLSVDLDEDRIVIRPLKGLFD